MEIFVSYSHKDSRWLDPGNRYNLIPWLQDSLRARGLMLWWDDSLSAGDRWNQVIKDRIDGAQIAILLITEQFISSDFIRECELPRIAEREEKGELQVVPVLVEACLWENVKTLARWQMTPGGPTPLESTIDPDRPAKFTEARKEILASVLRRAAPSPSASPSGSPSRSGSPSGPGTPATVPVTAFLFGLYTAQIASKPLEADTQQQVIDAIHGLPELPSEWRDTILPACVARHELTPEFWALADSDGGPQESIVLLGVSIQSLFNVIGRLRDASDPAARVERWVIEGTTKQVRDAVARAAPPVLHGAFEDLLSGVETCSTPQQAEALEAQLDGLVPHLLNWFSQKDTATGRNRQ